MTYTSKLKSEQTDELFKAILNLVNLDECYRFFEDIMTVNELKAVSLRWEVARLLNAGYTYVEVEKMTGASTATISRINKCINYGADGYNMMLERMAKR